MEISQIPAAWLSELAKVQEVDPDAMIAGGALRDLDHGLQVKDVDVFLTYREGVVEAVEEAVGRRLSILVPEPKHRSNNVSEYLSHFDDEVACVFDDGVEDFDWENGEYVTKPNPPYQFIFLQHGVGDPVSRIDFGLCRIGVGRSGVVVTPEYERDKRNKTFTLLRPRSVETALRRYERLKEKFPDHRLILPDDGR
jgi:hypothetical protein